MYVLWIYTADAYRYLKIHVMVAWWSTVKILRDCLHWDCVGCYCRLGKWIAVLW